RLNPARVRSASLTTSTATSRCCSGCSRSACADTGRSVTRGANRLWDTARAKTRLSSSMTRTFFGHSKIPPTLRERDATTTGAQDERHEPPASHQQGPPEGDDRGGDGRLLQRIGAGYGLVHDDRGEAGSPLRDDGPRSLCHRRGRRPEQGGSNRCHLLTWARSAAPSHPRPSAPQPTARGCGLDRGVPPLAQLGACPSNLWMMRLISLVRVFGDVKFQW